MTPCTEDVALIQEQTTGIVLDGPIGCRYQPDTDVLTVMLGDQTRWAARVIGAGHGTAYLDAHGRPIRVVFREASEVFPSAWLVRHYHRRSRPWRNA